LANFLDQELEEAGGGFRVLEAALFGDVSEVAWSGVFELLERADVFFGE